MYNSTRVRAELAADSLSCVVLRMAKVRLPVRLVLCGNLIVTNDEQVLRILLVSRLGEIECASHNRCSINDHDFIVCDRVH